LKGLEAKLFDSSDELDSLAKLHSDEIVVLLYDLMRYQHSKLVTKAFLMLVRRVSARAYLAKYAPCFRSHSPWQDLPPRLPLLPAATTEDLTTSAQHLPSSAQHPPAHICLRPMPHGPHAQRGSLEQPGPTGMRQRSKYSRTRRSSRRTLSSMRS
jgi:hypothetical protein